MSLENVVAGLLVVAILYAAVVLGLIVSGRGGLAREVAMLLPHLLQLFRGLMSDARVPRRAKVALAIAAVWLASPIDLIPEFIPIAGPLDHAIVAALVCVTSCGRRNAASSRSTGTGSLARWRAARSHGHARGPRLTVVGFDQKRCTEVTKNGGGDITLRTSPARH